MTVWLAALMVMMQSAVSIYQFFPRRVILASDCVAFWRHHATISSVSVNPRFCAMRRDPASVVCKSSGWRYKFFCMDVAHAVAKQCFCVIAWNASDEIL